MIQNKLSFQSQNLVVDYIKLKVKNLEYNEFSFSNFFFDLGFNSYRISAKLKNSIQEPILISDKNEFKVIFETDHSYWSGTCIVFSGLNANCFYSLVQKQLINWNLLNYPRLSRFDLYFCQKIRPSKESLIDFFHNCQEKIKLTNNCEINSKGTILRIGSRRSNNYARIYQKEKFLRFEHEMKYSFAEKYSPLLMKSNLQEFEFEMTKNFIQYFGKILPLDSDYTVWLISKIRPLRSGYQSSFQLKTDYIESGKITNFQDEKSLALFLQFLIYVNDLDFKKEFLGSTSYRCVHFSVRDFLYFENSSANYSTYRFKRLKNFIKNLQTNFIIQKFSDSYFQSLVSIPKVEFIKSKNQIIAQVWIVEDLFYYTYPFRFPNILDGKLRKNEFSVVSYIITTFSSMNIEKQFHIDQFFKSHSKLSNQDRVKIKKYFIEYIQKLINDKLIENKIFVIRDNVTYKVDKLTTHNISEGFIIYERLNF